jgi:hypothetical protein
MKTIIILTCWFLFLTLLSIISVIILRLFDKEVLLKESFNWRDYRGEHYGNKIIFYKYKYFDCYVRKEINNCHNKIENHPSYKKFQEKYNNKLKELNISNSQVKYKRIK